MDASISVADLKAKYLQLSKSNHPDKGGDVEKMKQINQAYDILKTKVGKGTSSKATSKSWDEIHKEWEERNKVQYPIMKQIFEDAFDEQKFLKYLQQFTEEPLNIVVETNEGKISKDKWQGAFLSFDAYIQVFNPDKTTYFTVAFWITYELPRGGSLASDAVDEKDILYSVNYNTTLYHDNKSHKMAKQNYQWKVGHETISDFNKIFPAVKVKKILSGGGKKTFRKQDFILGIKRELEYVSYEADDKIFIYPFGQNAKWYFHMYRSTFGARFGGGQKALASYMFGNTIFIDPQTKKYTTKYRLPVVTIIETEENFRKLINCIKEFVRVVEQQHLDYVADGEKIYDILVMSIKHYFKKDQ